VNLADLPPPPDLPRGRPPVIGDNVVALIRRLAGLHWSYASISRYLAGRPHELSVSPGWIRMIALGEGRKSSRCAVTRSTCKVVRP